MTTRSWNGTYNRPNDTPRLITLESIPTMNHLILQVENARKTIMGALGDEKGKALLGDRVRYDWEFAHKTQENVKLVELESLVNYGPRGDVYVAGHGIARLTFMGYDTDKPESELDVEVIVLPQQMSRTGNFGRVHAANNKAFREALVEKDAMNNPSTVQPEFVIPCTHSFYKDGEMKEVRMIYIIASQIGLVSAKMYRPSADDAPVEDEPLQSQEDELETALATS